MFEDGGTNMVESIGTSLATDQAKKAINKPKGGSDSGALNAGVTDSAP